MSNAPELASRGKLPISLSLTGIGGFVDAVGYIALFQVFTANMSGNSVHIGMSLGHGNWLNLARPLCAVFSYVVAMVLTRAAIEIAGRKGVRRIASCTLAVEAILLFLFARVTPAMHLGEIVDRHSPAYFTLVALLSFAMGVQTATLTRVGPLTIYTTFVTGTLTKMSESLTRVLFWAHDQIKHGIASHIVGLAFKQEDVRHSTILAATWGSYVIGAAVGTVSKERWELRSLYLPVALLAAFILIDQLWPIDVAEERHQTG